MNKNQIKQLAKLTTKNGKVDNEVATYALNNLSRKELIMFIRYLKLISDKNTVRILSGSEIPPSLKNELVKNFKDKNVVFEQNEKVGDGICAVINDTIIDLSLGGYVENTVEELKQTLN